LHDIFLSAADKDRRWGDAGLTNATDLKKAIGRASELDQSFGRPVLRRRRFNLGDEEDRGLRGTLPRPKIETLKPSTKNSWQFVQSVSVRTQSSDDTKLVPRTVLENK
jgi:hypothetical protein